jgi:hypothetical protein
VATNNDDATWNFVGPDGTSATYYTVPGSMLSATNNDTRYLRYRAYLDTVDPVETPVLSNVTVNYVSGCFAPGQAMFAGLTADVNYQLLISMTGYQSQTVSSLNIAGNNVLQITLSK